MEWTSVMNMMFSQTCSRNNMGIKKIEPVMKNGVEFNINGFNLHKYLHTFDNR